MKFFAVISKSLAVAVFLASAVLTARAQSPWAVRNQRAGGDDLWGITSGPAGLVAVGTNGAILQSPDGQTWTRRASGITDWLTAVTYGNNRYLAVGDRGRILSSPDGVTWSSVAQAATTQRFDNVLFAQNKFVAVGESGTILYSADGVAWSAAASGTTNWLRGLAFGQATLADRNGTLSGGYQQWIATGQSGTLLASADGFTWTAFDSHTTNDLETAAYADSIGSSAASPVVTSIAFAVAGAGGTAQMLVFRQSTASTGFEQIGLASSTTLTPPTSARIRGVIAGPHQPLGIPGNGSFVAIDEAAPLVALDESGGAFTNYGSFSPDFALTFPSNPWQTETLSPAVAMRAAIYFAGQQSFYAVGQGETVFQRDQVFNGRMGNISTRGLAAGGGQALFAGFVVRGVTSKPVLIRGVGPALTNFGLTGVLPQPILTVFDAGGKIVATNSGWGSNSNPAAISAAATSAGAFPFASGSSDSALLLTLAPGSYTAQVAGAAGSSGVALAEIYDLDPRVNGTARAINLSTRGQVAGGENVLIAGLNVQGPVVRQFLIRGVGPSLAQFGVANSLPDPVVLQAVPNGNGGVGFVAPAHDSAAVLTATNSTGAFPFAPNSADDAVVVTLAPGNYTFQLASKSNSTGVALIEIYEVGSP